jgi:hypothetical protein
MPLMANSAAAMAIACWALAAATASAQTVDTCYLTREEVEATTGGQLREGSPLERAQPNGSAVCTFVLRRGRDTTYRTLMFVTIEHQINERQSRNRGVRWMSGVGEVPRVQIQGLGDEAWYGGMTAFRKGNTIVLINLTGDRLANVSGARDREIEERLARLIVARIP